MGRTVKRVPLDFKYPMKMTWKGYVNPYCPLKCEACEGMGSSKEILDLSDDFYGFERPQNRWCDKLTQEEVDLLFEKGRFSCYQSPPKAEDVNKDNLIHDGVNHWILVKYRAEKLGITETECPFCEGNGHFWFDEQHEKLYENWDIEHPPKGEGFQLWETTSEGSPISPVFKTPEDLAKWLYGNNASVFGYQTWSYEEWLDFIKRYQ